MTSPYKGYVFGVIVTLFVLVAPWTAGAYGECTDYGAMATYDPLSGSCKCLTGYVFKDGYLGEPQCVSGDSVCTDKYGYGANYDSLSGSCECDYGYVFGKDSIGRTQCITDDRACQNQLGSHSRATYGGQCQCSYGYIIQGGQCVNGDSYCHSKYGLYSSYSDSGNKCECDSGYTLGDDGQCREKQNNVYFKLLDLDTDDNRAIIKSDYDSRTYLVEYGTGCYSYAFNRYVGKKIVVNLGTDFSVDRWDQIVLQDHDQTCDIRAEERTYEDSFDEQDEDSYYFIPSVPSSPVSSAETVTTVPPQEATNQATKVSHDFEVSSDQIKQLNVRGSVTSPAMFRKCPSTDCSVIRSYAEGSEVRVTGESQEGNWYQISGTTDAGGMGQNITGWIYKSLVQIGMDENQISTTTTKEDIPETEEGESRGFFQIIWSSFLGWFR